MADLVWDIRRSLSPEETVVVRHPADKAAWPLLVLWAQAQLADEMYEAEVSDDGDEHRGIIVLLRMAKPGESVVEVSDLEEVE